MQCPFCRSESIPDDAIFCPHCRYQFRPMITEPETGPVQLKTAVQESYEDPQPEHGAGSDVRLLEALLVTPAILVMIVAAAVLYTMIGSLPLMMMKIAGIAVSIAGPVCLAFGALAGWIFYRITLGRLG